MERLAALFAQQARWALHHGRLVGLLSLLVMVVSAAIGLPPKVDSNLLNLLPDSDPTVAAIKRINDEEGGVNVITMSWEGDDAARLDAFLDDLAARMEAQPLIQFALHHVDPQLALHIGLLQLDPGELHELTNRVRGAEALGPAASNPFIAQRLMAMGPLTEKIEKASKASLIGAASGRARLIIRPTISSSDPLAALQVMNEVRAVMDQVDPAAHGARLLWLGGAYRHTVEDVEGIRSDLVWTNVVSILAMVGILAVSFRSVRTLGIMLPPLFVANSAALAFAALAFGSLNTYTSFGTAILFGLGIDYSVHLVGRYRENRLAGIGVEEALAESWSLSGPPCATAAITSAAGFVALTVAEFQGFAQLGLLLAVGLMFCLLGNLLMLPPLIAWLEPDPGKVMGTATHRSDAPVPSYSWAPPVVAVLTLLTLGLGAWAFPQVGFEYDLSALRRDGMAYDELTELERQLARESYAPVVVSYGPEADLLHEQQLVEDGIASGAVTHLRAAVSLARALPPDQHARNEVIRELVSLVDDPDFRYLPGVIVDRLLPLRGLKVTDLSRDDLPLPVLHLLGATRPDVQRLLLFPKGNMWDVREAQALADEIHAVLPGRDAAGEQLGVASMFLYAFRDVKNMVALVILLVVMFTWLDLRRLSWTAGALLALAFGSIWATAALHLAGLKLSMINLTGVPILIGLGVDVVVHLSHRMREEGPSGLGHALRTTGVAAAISTATNAASFGSLMMAGNRGVRSLGVLVGVGLVVLTIVSVALLATLWAWGWRFKRHQEADAAAS